MSQNVLLLAVAKFETDKPGHAHRRYDENNLCRVCRRDQPTRSWDRAALALKHDATVCPCCLTPLPAGEGTAELERLLNAIKQFLEPAESNYGPTPRPRAADGRVLSFYSRRSRCRMIR